MGDPRLKPGSRVAYPDCLEALQEVLSGDKMGAQRAVWRSGSIIRVNQALEWNAIEKSGRWKGRYGTGDRLPTRAPPPVNPHPRPHLTSPKPQIPLPLLVSAPRALLHTRLGGLDVHPGSSTAYPDPRNRYKMSVDSSRLMGSVAILTRLEWETLWEARSDQVLPSTLHPEPETPNPKL